MGRILAHIKGLRSFYKLICRFPVTAICISLYITLYWTRKYSTTDDLVISFSDAYSYITTTNKTKPYLDRVIINGCGISSSEELEGNFNLDVWESYCQLVIGNSEPDHRDPRTSIAIWVQQIDNHLTDFGSLDGLKLAFNWSRVLNINPHSNLHPNKIFTCRQLFNHLGFLKSISPQKLSQYCTEVAGSLILGPIDFKTSEYNYNIINRIYLANSMSIPNRIIFTINNSSMIIPTENNAKAYYPACSVNYPQLITQLSSKLAALKKDKDDYPIFDYPRLITHNIPPQVNVSKSEFIYKFQDFFQSLSARTQFVSNIFDQQLMDSMVNHISSEPNNLKYFQEPKLFKNNGGHFDWRFFRTTKYSDYERINILNCLSKSWLAFANSIGIKTWLAHGTLLGWYWNGLNLPWDNDLDVQVTIDSLKKLARNYNNSMIINLDDSNHFGKYLLDINPNFYRRDKDDGGNLIDGRFIDVETGFYIDITALSFSADSKYLSISRKDLIEFNQMLDPDYMNQEESKTIVKTEYHKKLFNQRADLINQQLIYNCKNNHFYKLSDLHPLLLSQFENQLAYVPGNYKNILLREYPKSIYYKIFNDYCYNPWLRLWIKCKICNSNTICEDQNSLAYHNFTKAFTSIHKQNMHYRMGIYNLSSQFYVDPWLIRQLKRRIIIS